MDAYVSDNLDISNKAYRNMNLIQSNNHLFNSKTVNKHVHNANDDNRVIVNDEVQLYSYPNRTFDLSSINHKRFLKKKTIQNSCIRNQV